MKQLAMFLPAELSGLAAAFFRAADEWGLNCGPGAICGALAITPEWVRPHLGDFEQRGHMTPTQMWAALRSLGVRYKVWRCGQWPRSNGIVRLQWGGPWCDLGKPPAAAYRYTHWVAGRRNAYDGSVWVFDVNNLSSGLRDEHGLPLNPDGWLPHAAWAGEVVPQLLPIRGDGTWWITHTAEFAL